MRFGDADDGMLVTNMQLPQLLRQDGFSCSCGRRHCALPLRYLDISDGALERLPEMLRPVVQDGTIFLITDERIESAAGQRTAALLERHRFGCMGLPRYCQMKNTWIYCARPTRRMLCLFWVLAAELSMIFARCWQLSIVCLAALLLLHLPWMAMHLILRRWSLPGSRRRSIRPVPR